MHKRLSNIAERFTIQSEGAVELLDRHTCSFLLSRKERRPGPGDWWVNAARDAARWVSGNNMVAVAGGGLIHLDFTRWVFHSFGPVIYVDMSEFMSGKTTGAGPAPDHWCDLRLLPTTKQSLPKKELLRARDELVADLSDTLIAIAVRKGGIMERIGLEAITAGKKVMALEPPSRSIEYSGNWNLLEHGAIKLELGDRKLPSTESKKKTKSATIKTVNCPLSTADYLWHFTRECPGPWPGETWGTYFSALASGARGSGHSALDTLSRILSEERIRASGSLIRGGHPVVCWSGALPEELMKIPNYRAALARWEFQPYAIGIRRNVAQKLGMEKVLCLASEEYSSIAEKDRFRFQAKPKGKARWSEAEEWRNPGDFPLTDLHPSEGAVLVNTQSEIAEVLPNSRFPVISLARQ